MVLPEPLPTVSVGIEVEEFGRRRVLVDQLVALKGNLHAVDREEVAAAPIKVPATVIVLEQAWVPRARRHFVGLHQRGIAVVDRARKRRHRAHQEVELAGLGRRRNQDRTGSRERHGGPQDQPVAVGIGGRRDDAAERPARWGDESPVDQVGRAPIAVSQRHEEVISALVADDHRVSAGAVADAPVGLLPIVAVIDIDRVDVGAFLGRGRRGGERQDDGTQQQRLDRHRSSSLVARADRMIKRGRGARSGSRCGTGSGVAR